MGCVGVNRKWSGISLGVMWGVWESAGSGLGLVWGVNRKWSGGHVGCVGVNWKWSGISLGVIWGVWESTRSCLGFLMSRHLGVCGQSTGSGLGSVWDLCGSTFLDTISVGNRFPNIFDVKTLFPTKISGHQKCRKSLPVHF